MSVQFKHNLIRFMMGFFLIAAAAVAYIWLDNPSIEEGADNVWKTAIKPAAQSPHKEHSASETALVQSATTGSVKEKAAGQRSEWKGLSEPELTTRSQKIQIPRAYTRSSPLKVGDEVEFALIDDSIVSAMITKSCTNVNGTVSTTARIKNSETGRVYMACTNGELLCNIVDYDNKRLHVVEYNRHDGNHYLLERDYAAMIDADYKCPDPLIPPIENRERKSPILASDAVVSSSEGVVRVMNDSSSTLNYIIDVMFVWSQNVENAVGTTTMNNRIALCITAMNDIHANSNTGMEYNLVHSVNTGWAESDANGDSSVGVSDGLYLLTLSQGESLDGFSDPSGLMDNIHTLRDTYNADYVNLAMDGNLGGVAWVATTSPEYAFSVVGSSNLTSGLTTAHEFGHNMGLKHAYDQNFQPGYPDKPQNGWHWHGNGFNRCSVMSYANGSYFADGISHTRVPHFSDPTSFDTQAGQPRGDVTHGDSVSHLTGNKTSYISHRSGNHSPVITTNTMLTADEGVIGTIGTSLLDSGDPDNDLNDHIPANRTFTITTAVSNGTLFLDLNGSNTLDLGEALGVSGTFTQQDVDDNKLKFLSATPYAGGGSESFVFDLKDDDASNPLGPENQTFDITVIPAVASYTVDYHANGGTSPPASQTKTHDVTLTLKGQESMTFAGHTFAGWNTQAGGGGDSYPAFGTYTNNAAVTLYAQWKTSASTLTIAVIPSATYTGTAITPEPEVKDGATVLTMNSDYTLSYSNNVNVGVATVTVTGIGDYGGTQDTTFSITQATPSVTVWPTASDIIFRQTLASSTLTGGTASVTGSFAFTTPTTAPSVGTAAQDVTFTPTDSANYTTVGGFVDVTCISTFYLKVTGGKGSGYYVQGAVVTVRVNPAQEGYLFRGWSGDVAGLDNKLAGKTTFTMGSNDARIAAIYEKKDYGSWNDEGFHTDSDGCSLHAGKGTGMTLPITVFLLAIALGRCRRRSTHS